MGHRRDISEHTLRWAPHLSPEKGEAPGGGVPSPATSNPCGGSLWGWGPAASLESCCRRKRFPCGGSPAPEEVVRFPLPPGSLKAGPISESPHQASGAAVETGTAPHRCENHVHTHCTHVHTHNTCTSHIHMTHTHTRDPHVQSRHVCT